MTTPASPPTDDRDDWRVSLTEAFYHPRFGVVLWHDYPDHDDTFVMSAKLNDESRAQAFVDDYLEDSGAAEKPAFSLN